MVKMVQDRVDVAEANRQRGFGLHPPKPRFAAREGISLVGLDGGGKRHLGKRLAEDLGMPVLICEPSGLSVEEAVEQGPAVIVVAEELLQDEKSRMALRGNTKVFYMMAESGQIVQAAVEAGADPDQIRSELAQRQAVIEPLCMGMLHFIIQGVRGEDEMYADALEKARL